MVISPWFQQSHLRKCNERKGTYHNAEWWQPQSVTTVIHLQMNWVMTWLPSFLDEYTDTLFINEIMCLFCCYLLTFLYCCDERHLSGFQRKNGSDWVWTLPHGSFWSHGIKYFRLVGMRATQKEHQTKKNHVDFPSKVRHEEEKELHYCLLNDKNVTARYSGRNWNNLFWYDEMLQAQYLKMF